MSRHRQLGYGIRLPDAWVEPIQDFVSTMVSANFKITLATPTTIQIVAGSDNDLVSIGISGKWRFNTATVQRAHPGGAAGTYDAWVVTADNNYVAGTPETDNTDYSFDLRILAGGAPSPATGAGGTAFARKIATLQWDGTKITRIGPLIGTVLTATDFVAVTPDSPARNLMTPSGDFVPFTIRRRDAADGSDLFVVQDAAGTPIIRFTNDGIVMFRSMGSGTRDALSATHRPPGGVFYNTDTKQLETNIGTDAVPLWAGVGGYGPGIVLDFTGPESQIPPRTVTADGRQLSKVAEPGLWNKLSANGTLASPWDTFGGLAAPAAGNFRVPDLRGRGTVGKKDMGAGTAPALVGAAITRAAAATLGALLGEEFHTLIVAEIPSLSGTTGIQSNDHTHTGTTGTESADHAHNDSGHAHVQHAQTDYEDVRQARNVSGSNWDESAPSAGRTTGTGYAVLGGRTVAHTHSFTSAGMNLNHTHAWGPIGGGGSHENVFPVAVVNKLVTL